jgi:peptidoglycan glycosyltransferase
MGIALGADRLRATAERFGFEQRLPIEIDAAVSRLGRPAYLNDRGGLGFTAFGQGELEATPLEMALVAATIANGGTAPTPHLARELRAPDGRVLDRFNPGPWHSVVRPETSRFVGQAMGALVEAGQAPAAGLPGVAVAGKTGTAEVGPGVEPHAWFVAYAPADNPQIALAVIIENGGFGSRAAVPVAAQVLRAALNR